MAGRVGIIMGGLDCQLVQLALRRADGDGPGYYECNQPDDGLPSVSAEQSVVVMLLFWWLLLYLILWLSIHVRLSIALNILPILANFVLSIKLLSNNMILKIFQDYLFISWEFPMSEILKQTEYHINIWNMILISNK